MKNSEKAVELFESGYNCAQAVVMAYADEMGMDEKTASTLASSFGGGMGRLGEVCGAVSGMFMVLGVLYGYSDPSDRLAKMEHYTIIKQFGEKFKNENGSLLCRELLKAQQDEDAPRCVDLVERACQMLDKYIEEKGIVK